VYLRQFYVYILTNKMHSVLYTGVTNDLVRRVYEHRGNFVDGFTKRYKVHKLIYYEVAENAEAAITREKQIKSWSRKRKEELIASFNPVWAELYDKL
jgi:putative endonuclease